MPQVTVNLAERSYPIDIGSGWLADSTALAERLTPHIRGQQVAIISNKTVANIYLAAVLEALADYQVDVFSMRDGEEYKSIETYAQALDFLLQHRHNRSTCLIALGGGVVGDLCGFVAATLQRGVDFIQIPTTLLAQVDSSVGGKTAVNHPVGKNLIGAFHQPVAVCIDTDALATLPLREYAAGLAEVVKYGVITDADFFGWLESNADLLARRDPEALQYAIATSCRIKAEVVAADEREGGRRAILNYGHTFGHAIEKLCGYGVWLHGEAVAIGMVMAAHLSTAHTGLPAAQVIRIEKLLEKLHLPTQWTGRDELQVDAATLLSVMGMDKKAVDGRVRFILAADLGQVDVVDDVAPETIEALWLKLTQAEWA